MLDLKLIRRDPETVRAALARRGEAAAAAVDGVLALDERRRELLPRLEALRAEQNEANAAIAAAKKAGGDAAEELARMREVASEAKTLAEELSSVEAELEPALAALPNLPDESAALGGHRHQGGGETRGAAAATTSSSPAPWIDMERGARLSGSRFAFLRGPLARLELGLVSWALDILGGHGFEAVIPPVLVREEALYGTGFLPDTEQQIYKLADDDLYLVGTSEVALASLHAGEIVEADELPLRYAGFSSCFRREAGAAGKDTRGIFRVHQFDKVEMFVFCEPGESAEWHERLLAIEEEILQAPGHPVPRGQHRGRRPRGRARPRSTTARRGCRGRSATAS